MKKKVAIAVIAVTVIIVLSVFLSYTYFLSGKIYVSAISKKPSDTIYQDQIIDSVSVDVFEGGRKIGKSYEAISLPLGRHTISFGNYSDFETPAYADVEVTPFGTANVKAEYLASFGLLNVASEFYNAYTQKSETVTNVTLYVDGQPKGTNSVVLRFDKDSLGRQHLVTCDSVQGYTTPTSYPFVEQGKTTIVKLTYEKILSAEEQQYIWLRNKVTSTSSIDTQSTTFKDMFYLWTLEKRVNVPVCYYYIYGNDLYWGQHKGSVDIYIAQYAGILQEERTKALETIYNQLISVGIDLKNTGTIKVLTTSGAQESIVTVEVDIDIQRVLVEEVVGGKNIYGLDKAYTTNIPNLFPQIVPVGMAYLLPNSGLYVKIGDSTTPMNTVYTGFQEFSSGEPINTGGYYNLYDSLSISAVADYYFSDSITQLENAISAGVMSTLLLNPQGFCESLLWTA